MAEVDSLAGFDFSRVSKPGKFLKFEAGKPVTVRILTKDPVVQETEFKNGNEVNMSLKFCFIVWNWTDEMAQILTAPPSMAKAFQRIGADPDFGENLQKCDIKISPEGEKLERVYDINVLRHSGNELTVTKEIVAEAKQIDLDSDVKDNRGRLSTWDPAGAKPSNLPGVTDQPVPDDVVVEDINEEEPINLDDIPF